MALGEVDRLGGGEAFLRAFDGMGEVTGEQGDVIGERRRLHIRVGGGKLGGDVVETPGEVVQGRLGDARWHQGASSSP